MKTVTQQKILGNPLDESGHSPTPNSLTELSEYQPKTRWEPGRPIPRRGSGIEPNAVEALTRNADAYEQFKRDEERKRLADRRAA